MRKGRRICLFLTSFSLLFFCVSFFPASAQEIEFASSPNPVGSGARALGMGGAFIAVADDATAASWNPSGLIQLESPEISIVGAGYYRSEDNTISGHQEADGSQSIRDGNLNYLSGAYPFTMMGHNMVVSLTYQHLYDFNRSWQFDYLPDFSKTSGPPIEIDGKVDYNQEGGLSAVGFSYAAQLADSLSFGLTMNIWDDNIGSNSWEQNTYFTGSGTLGPYLIDQYDRKIDKYSFSGLNFNLGFLWRITESLTLGAVYKTPFTADIEHSTSVDGRITSNVNSLPLSTTNNSANYDEEMEMPASYGIGLAYRFSDKLTTSFDLYRTEWGDMMYTDHEGTKTSAISGLDESESDIDATVQARAGIEYLLIQPKYLVPLRAGIFYDPAPSEGGSDDFYGFAMGSGFAMGRYIFDVGYQFRYGSDVGSAILKEGGDLSQEVKEHTLYASLILHF